MKVLYHVADSPVVEQLDTTLYNILPGEPCEVDSDFHATKLIEYYGMAFGLVEVPMQKGKAGWSYDLETAKARAEKALVIGEQMMINIYIKTQLEDRIRRNFPALPPNDRVAGLVKKYNINLEAYGIRPVGMPIGSPLGGAFRTHDQIADKVSKEEYAQLKADNKVLMGRLEKLEKLLQ